MRYFHAHSIHYIFEAHGDNDPAKPSEDAYYIVVTTAGDRFKISRLEREWEGMRCAGEEIIIEKIPAE